MMPIDEYLIVFLSILIGLALADLAFSFHRLLRRGRAIRWDALMPAAGLVVLALILNLWWAIFGWYRDGSAVSFLGFLPDVALVLSLFLLAASTFPDEALADGASMRELYMNGRRHFWWTFAVYLTAVIVKATLVLGERGLLDDWLFYQWDNILFLLAAIGLGFTRRALAHAFVIGAWFVVILIQWADLRIGG